MAQLCPFFSHELSSLLAFSIDKKYKLLNLHGFDLGVVSARVTGKTMLSRNGNDARRILSPGFFF